MNMLRRRLKNMKAFLQDNKDKSEDETESTTPPSSSKNNVDSNAAISTGTHNKNLTSTTSTSNVILDNDS